MATTVPYVTNRGEDYDARFERLAAAGQYLHGEADLVEALLVESRGIDQSRGARILDAGCGTGRVTIELVRRGFDVTGLDVDLEMISVAQAKAPEIKWHLADLSTFTRDGLGPSEPVAASEPVAGYSGGIETNPPDGTFDLVLVAGNVLIFVSPGTEGAVVSNLARVLSPVGRVVAGFQVGDRLTPERYDTLCDTAGLDLESRWATWDRDPYEGGNYAVSVHRIRDDP